MSGPLDKIPEPEQHAYPATWVSAYPVEPQPEIWRWARIARDRRRTIATAFFAVLFIAVIGLLLAKPVYMARASVIVETRKSSMAFMGEMPMLSDLFRYGGGSSVDNQVVVLSSRDLQQGVMKKCGLEGKSPGDYLGVESIPNTDIIEVTARARTRSLAQKLVAALVNDYIALTAREAAKAADKAAEFVGAQLNRVKVDLATAEANLRDFKERHKAVALDVQTQAQVQRLADLVRDFMVAGAEAEAAARQIREAQKQLSESEKTIVASVSMAPSPVLDQWERTLTELEATRASLLQEYNEDSERIRSVDEQIASARKRVAELHQQQMDNVIRQKQETVNPLHQMLLQQIATLRASSVALKAKSGALSRAIKQEEDELATLPQKEYEMADLIRAVATNQAVYKLLTEKHEELRISAQADQPSARVLDEPKSGRRPVSPRKRLTLVVAAVLGTIIGLLLAAGQEYTDTTVRTTEEIERILSAPVMGHIPRTSGAAGALTGMEGPAPFAEGYRIVRSNIARSTADSPPRTLLITSAGPREGKSLTAINLASALARQGKSVILVDADMRKPAIHERLKLDNDRGLSDVLAGRASVTEALQDGGADGLRVLTSGHSEENAADLLASGKLDQVLAELSGMADVVIIDSPPVLPLADSLILAASVDGVLLVVGSRLTTRRGLARAREVMDHAGARVIGAVLNNVDLQRDRVYDEHLQYLAEYYSGGKPRRWFGRQPPSLPPGPSS